MSDVVLKLARRYLVHARTSPALKPDVDLLYGLALLYGEGDWPALPEILRQGPAGPGRAGRAVGRACPDGGGLPGRLGHTA